MNYATIKNCDIANGEGVRVTLFVSGCTNHCKNCFQPQTWDFDYGQPFTEETEKNFDRTSLEAELERLFSEQVKLEISGDFTVKNREIDEIKGGLRLKTAVLAEENIATQDIMLFNTGNS